MLAKNRPARTVSLLVAILLTGLLGSAAQATRSVGAESPGQLVRQESTAHVTVDDVVHDMFGPRFRSDNRWRKNVKIGASPWGAHDALPVGADRNWDFYHGARFGDEPPWDGYLNIWGQLFTTSSTQQLGVRLQVRNPQLWYLAADDVWRRVVEDQRPDTKLTGRYDQPNTFRHAPVSSSDMGRRSEGAGQGWSVRLAPFDRSDVGNFHWWYDEDYGVKPKVPTGTKALFVAAEMRLIHDVDLSIDLDREVNVIAGMGSDHWPFASGSAGYGAPIELSSFMQPRMKFVTSEWNTFTAHSFTAWFDGSTPDPAKMNGDLIRRYPPPLVGAVRTTSRLAEEGPRYAPAVRLAVGRGPVAPARAGSPD